MSGQGEIVSNHTYHHEWPETSSSQFKAFYDSPAAYRWPLPREHQDAYDLGTATHTCVLEPDRVEDLLVLPDASIATKAGKDIWRLWLETHGVVGVEEMKLKADFMAAANRVAIDRDTSVVTPEQLATARAMSLSVSECAEAQEALKGTVRERSFRANGRKARPDALGNGLLVDVKTTSKFDRFQWAALDLRYPESLAWYERVLADCGISVNYWLWLAVETTPYRLSADGLQRHRVKVWIASDDARDEAKAALEKALERLTECERTDVWPGPDDEIGTIYPRNYK